MRSQILVLNILDLRGISSATFFPRFLYLTELILLSALQVFYCEIFQCSVTQSYCLKISCSTSSAWRMKSLRHTFFLLLKNSLHSLDSYTSSPLFREGRDNTVGNPRSGTHFCQFKARHRRHPCCSGNQDVEMSLLAVQELMAHLEVACGAQCSVMLMLLLQSEGITQAPLSVMQAPLLTLFSSFCLRQWFTGVLEG